MSKTWMVAGVQMDCTLGDKAANLLAMGRRLTAAARPRRATRRVPRVCLDRLWVRFTRRRPRRSPNRYRDRALRRRMVQDCQRLGVWAVYGLIEAAPDGKLFNTAALVGPNGFIASYRKVHLPCLGAGPLH